MKSRNNHLLVFPKRDSLHFSLTRREGEKEKKEAKLGANWMFSFLFASGLGTQSIRPNQTQHTTAQQTQKVKYTATD